MALQAVPLLFTPSLIVSMLAAEPRRMTDLEAYFSRSSALLLLAFAVLNLLLTGLLPVANSWDSITSSAGGGADSEGLSKNPYAFPTLVVTTTYHALTAFYIYMQIAHRGSFAFYAGLVFSTALFCMGMWVIVFGSEKGKISKRTGADKRTSGFPFENKESAREKKREEKEKEKEKSKRRSVPRTTSSRG